MPESNATTATNCFQLQWARLREQARPPRGLSLHQESLILSAQSWNTNSTDPPIGFPVKMLCEKPITSDSTTAAVHESPAQNRTITMMATLTQRWQGFYATCSWWNALENSDGIKARLKERRSSKYWCVSRVGWLSLWRMGYWCWQKAAMTVERRTDYHAEWLQKGQEGHPPPPPPTWVYRTMMQ